MKTKILAGRMDKLSRLLVIVVSISLLTSLCAYAPNRSKTQVVFIGDSIIQGWNIFYPELFESGKWINAGKGGQTTSQILERFDRDVLQLKPKMVVIMGGTNDIAGLGGNITINEIFLNLETMIRQARGKGITVVLCSVLPAYEYACCPTVKPIPLISELNARLKDLARRNKLNYIDYYGLLVDKRKGITVSLSDDGVHPNRSGYAKMLPLTMSTMLDAYGRRDKKNE